MNRKILFCILILTTLLSVQLVFMLLQRTQAEQVRQSINTVLRQEAVSSNLFLMSRSLSDLQHSGLMKCTTLKKSEDETSYLDLSFKGNCTEHDWILNGTTSHAQIQTLNGEIWEINFKTVNGSFFYLSLWLTRILATGAMSIGIALYFKRVEKIKEIQERQEQLKQLAAQTAHDVASPLSALAIAGESKLIPEEIRELLKAATKRTFDIVTLLKEQSSQIENSNTSEGHKINLATTLKAVLKEKQARFPKVVISNRVPNSFVYADEVELSRVLSNLINNAAEAIPSSREGAIELTLIVHGPTTQLCIIDNGNGIPSQHIASLGKRGFSFGKNKGSGLGLFHAYQQMAHWKGNILISSNVGEGTQVTLSFRNTL